MFFQIEVSETVVQKLSQMDPLEICLIAGNVAASDEIGFLTKDALAEAEEQARSGQTQDVIIFKGFVPIAGYPGPWKEARFLIWGTSTNPQLCKVTDAFMRLIAPCAAEMLRERLLPEIPSENVGAEVWHDVGGFGTASAKKLAERRATLLERTA
jgi:hypothetical protein